MYSQVIIPTIPAKAGIQQNAASPNSSLDSRMRGNGRGLVVQTLLRN